MSDSLCFIIPCYQHADTLKAVLAHLAPSKSIVVNDGSDAPQSQKIKEICTQFENAVLIHHKENQGKGGAVISGLKKGLELGFSHGFQIDSDGQHDLKLIDKFIDASKKNPLKIISGQPIYDDKVPKSRLYGRYITHFWVVIETLSFQIKDSMCGFRIYPLKETLSAIKNDKIGRRMDFDIEIMVRLFWAKIYPLFIPIAVTYPEGGLSHFQTVKDNYLISKMHTKLFFGMLFRLPILLYRKFNPTKDSSHWIDVEEKGSQLGMKILLLLHTIFGNTIISLFLRPVCYYFSKFDAHIKKVASQYIQNYQRFCELKKITPQRISVFLLVFSFAKSILDKFSVWKETINLKDIATEDVQLLHSYYKKNKGALFISSHYGNLEISRALGQNFKDIQFKALMHIDNSKKFSQLIADVNPSYLDQIIPVKNFGLNTAMMLKGRVDQGEWIFTMGDRLSINEKDNFIEAPLLGAPAKLPLGAFIMAYILEVPVYIFHCYKQKKKFRLKITPIPLAEHKGRENRQAYLEKIIEIYIKDLEDLILNDPLQWYNFFEFWKAQHE